MEKILQEKIKKLISDKQFQDNNISDKSINSLITWLNNNKKILTLGDKWKSLERSLLHFETTKTFDVTNIVIHAHYHPTNKDVDDILITSQHLLEWALCQE